MKKRTALTLVEMVLVMSLAAIMGTGSLLAVNNFRQKQALTASAQEFSDAVLRAHIYAREEKSESSWAIKRISGTKYTLVSGTKTSFVQKEIHQTEDPAYLLNNDFEIWFNRATGNTNTGIQIKLSTPNGFLKTIDINEYGVVKTF